VLDTWVEVELLSGEPEKHDGSRRVSPNDR